MSQYTLPVSDEERLAWTHKVPGTIKCAVSDYVSLHATGNTVATWQKALEGDPNMPDRNCYAGISPRYDLFKITCYPKNNGRWLSLEQVHEFYDILLAHGMVPPGIKMWEQNDKDWRGILCHLGKNLGSPHLYYVALTCYRWVDCHAPLVWEFLQIMGDGTPRHPLQVLPYLTGKWDISPGHNFVTGYTGGDCNHTGAAVNPLLGLAGKTYFDQSDPRGNGLYKSPNQSVNESIAAVAKEITTTLDVSGKNSWNKEYTIQVPKYVLDEPIDALHPALYELYTIPNITNAQAGKILAGLFTKEKEA